MSSSVRLVFRGYALSSLLDSYSVEILRVESMPASLERVRDYTAVTAPMKPEQRAFDSEHLAWSEYCESP